MALTARQISSLATGKPTRVSDGKGLYFVVPKFGEPYWALRYIIRGQRRQMSLGKYQDLSLADARHEAETQKKLVREGQDPLLLKERSKWANISTISELFADWYKEELVKRLKHPNIPKRIFTQNIEPVIGRSPVGDVTPLDIREVIRRVVESGRPSIANDTLMYMKQLFRYAIKMDFTLHNPAAAFTISDAGGIENSRDRVLSPHEIEHTFKVFRENIASFGRDNYLACGLILVLGVRKSEMCNATWAEFDLERGVWELPKERSKSGRPLDIPLPAQAINWLEELKVRSHGSEYVFPARRASSRPHMGPDTLNRAISKLFGREAGRKKQPPNIMGEVQHFTVHDLRRTFRSLAAKLNVPGEVAERCLNHALKGVEGIYNRHDYYQERVEAHQKVADFVEPLVSDAPVAKRNVVNIKDHVSPRAAQK